jgi:hypothetical protein
MFGLRELLDIQNCVLLDTRHSTRPQPGAALSKLSASWVQAGPERRRPGLHSEAAVQERGRGEQMLFLTAETGPHHAVTPGRVRP